MIVWNLPRLINCHNFLLFFAPTLYYPQISTAIMLDEAEYASDTDESDEDYMPDADGENVASENESDGEPETALDEGDADGIKSNRRSRKRTATATVSTESKRSKSAAAATAAQTDSKSTDKDAFSDDDDDERGDALWASFLGNSGPAAPKVQTLSQTSKTSTSSPSSSSAATSNGKTTAKPIADNTVTKMPIQPIEKKRIVTEIFEFAGEKVEVQKEVKIDDEKPTPSNCNPKQNPAKSAASATAPAAAVTLPSLGRRPAGGLSSVLGQLGKKNKLSVLEKTKLDWTGFKRNEGIDEELQTHNKGRDGYLERQDFLQRTDLRQFEIEKSMRQTHRRK